MASHGRGMDFSIQDHYGNYRVSRVNSRLYLVFPISPLPLIGFWTYLVLTESHSPGESNAIGFKKFGAELAGTSDNTGIAPPGHIDGYWHLPYGEFPIQSLDLKRRQSSLSSKTFPEVFGMVLG